MNRARAARLLAAVSVLLAAGGSGACLAAPGASADALLYDWQLQDHGRDVKACFTSKAGAAVESAMLSRVLDELGGAGGAFRAEMGRLAEQKVPGADGRWRELYVRACRARRARRLRPLLASCARIVFTKHYNLGGSHYAYTEGQSDAQAERSFRAGTALCVLELDAGGGTVRTLLADAHGVIRDPDVSYDGKRILLAWKKSNRQDDYHLYEMDAATGKVRQLTFGLGFADYEGAYLPSGDIIFNSTRCVQIVDCWWTEVSNLYTCDKDGRFLRRLSFDQVHTNFPTVTEDGRVIYTRWDYNDRGQVYPQPLFQMNTDGTCQTELYGNNSWFPTTVLHARAIPGTQRLLAVLSGHHCHQRGKLAVLDPTVGQQEAAGAQLVAPIRETKAVRVDAYGQSGEQWQYPYPVTETEFLVTYDPHENTNRRYVRPFGIYFQDVSGRRELLAWDEKISCNQPIPLAPRKRPRLRPSAVNYRRKTGVYYVKDVCAGPGLAGIERGVVKRLRVVALEYRAAGIGSNGSGGPAGGAMASTPVSVRNGTWDVKRVLGSVAVREDGSAMFTVPARTPVYFQLIDDRGRAVQSMRSWSTLQPGETFSCVGCHEPKSEAPGAPPAVTQALAAGPARLEGFYGPPRGFSFPKEVQPILDRHCIRCHKDRSKVPAAGPRRRGGRAGKPGKVPASASHRHAPDAVSALSDGVEPKSSGDTSIPRFTWWSHRGTVEWVQYDFPRARCVTGVKVYWFEDRGGCRRPESWRLLYKDGGKWQPVATLGEYATDVNRYVPLTFAPVTTTALRIEVQLRRGFSGGILEWKVTGEEVGGAEAVAAKPKPAPKPASRAFSLLGETQLDARSKRHWSDAYLALTAGGRPNRIVQWLNVQSIPPMLPPYYAGSAKSELIAMLEKGHKNVKLSREEMDKLCCWIDLLVPYCGDYLEANAWSDAEKAKYARYQAKRERMEQLERENIAAFLAAEAARAAGKSAPAAAGPYRNVAVNPGDVRGKAAGYPHATSNSECRNEPCFAARCAIDGLTENRGHGKRFPSWGPDKRKDLWWKVEFGRAVEVDKLVLYLRADFPHDRHWHTATIEFSDGSREKVRIRKTHEPQTFPFAKRKVTWLRLTDLVQDEPMGWCALTEVEVWGRDAPAAD